MLDQHAVTDVLLDTVRGEGRNTDLSPLVQVVHSTARPALHTTTLLAVLNRLGVLLVLLVLVVLELVVDEGSRSAIVLSRSAVVVSWLAMADTGVDPGTAVTGAVVVLSFTHQIESADHQNLNKCNELPSPCHVCLLTKPSQATRHNSRWSAARLDTKT